jgi:cyanophycinase
MVFFSGGNPSYLASVLEDTRCWSAIVEGLGSGLAFGGCSAGAAALGERTTWRLQLDPLGPGLALFPGTNLAPHWDAIDRFRPGQRERVEASLGADALLVGIDERTAMVGDGRDWSLIGSGGVHVLESGRWAHHLAGSSFDLDLRADKVNGR